MCLELPLEALASRGRGFRRVPAARPTRFADRFTPVRLAAVVRLIDLPPLRRPSLNGCSRVIISSDFLGTWIFDEWQRPLSRINVSRRIPRRSADSAIQKLWIAEGAARKGNRDGRERLPAERIRTQTGHRLTRSARHLISSVFFLYKLLLLSDFLGLLG